MLSHFIGFPKVSVVLVLGNVPSEADPERDQPGVLAHQARRANHPARHRQTGTFVSFCLKCLIQLIFFVSKRRHLGLFPEVQVIESKAFPGQSFYAL